MKRRYHTILSVGVATLVLTLPLALLAFWPEPTQATGMGHTQLSDLRQGLDELNDRISSLTSSIEKMLESVKTRQPKEDAVEPSQAERVAASPAPAKTVEPDVAAREEVKQPAESLGDAQLAVLAGKFDMIVDRLNDMTAEFLVDRVAKMEEAEVSDSAGAEDQVALAPSIAPVAEASTDAKKPTGDLKATTKSVDRDRSTRKSKTTSRTPRPRGKSRTASRGEPAPPVGEDPSARPDLTLIPLAVAQPRNGSVVERIVNMVAYTEQPGWPVVMTRSDVDGDNWWVQQIVSRRGNYIAARVNFGNVDTLVGSRFQMVVLLLDTHEEAVRFRTARQFPEVPKGIRHSQVFHYMRQ